MNVYEMDARTIRDSVALFTGASNRTPRRWSRSEIRVDTWTKTFHSYGSHFPLAHYSVGEKRQRPLWIINGDAWRGMNGSWGHRSRTPEHQAETRRAIADTGIRSIVLPFTALEGANIVVDSIRPVHVRADAEWTETRYADVLEDLPRHERSLSEIVTHRTPLHLVPENQRHEWREATELEHAARVARMHETNPHIPADTLSRFDRFEIQPDDDGLYTWTSREWRPREPDDDGRYSWIVHVHRLGDSLFSARRRRADGTLSPRARYLSSFDTNETPPLYFLAQVPRGAGDTVETALDALAPAAVHAAIARGRRVYRQGDIFYIETDQTRETLATAGARFARLTLWTRDARPKPDEIGGTPKPPAAERKRRAERAARYRRREWLETFRALPANPSLHGPETPKGERARAASARARTERNVDTARATLRHLTWGGPPLHVSSYYGVSRIRSERLDLAIRTVQARQTLERALAELERARQHRGAFRDNYRHHNLPAKVLWTRASQLASERFYPETRQASFELRRERARRAASIYGTSHSATELAHVHGATYARGVARHIPALDAGATWADRNRGADHRPFTLGDGSAWYLTLRNRVPRDV